MVLPITAESPLDVYLDASVLIDYCWTAEPRHAQAVQLMELFGRNASLVILHASNWTWMETHGALYDKILERFGIHQSTNVPLHKWPKKRPRTYFPPLRRKLSKATMLIEQNFRQLREHLNLNLDEPDDTIVRVLNIARHFAKYGGIYPQDSFHVATQPYSAEVQVLDSERRRLTRSLVRLPMQRNS